MLFLSKDFIGGVFLTPCLSLPLCFSCERQGVIYRAFNVDDSSISELSHYISFNYPKLILAKQKKSKSCISLITVSCSK